MKDHSAPSPELPVTVYFLIWNLLVLAIGRTGLVIALSKLRANRIYIFNQINYYGQCVAITMPDTFKVLLEDISGILI